MNSVNSMTSKASGALERDAIWKELKPFITQYLGEGANIYSVDFKVDVPHGARIVVVYYDDSHTLKEALLYMPPEETYVHLQNVTRILDLPHNRMLSAYIQLGVNRIFTVSVTYGIV